MDEEPLLDTQNAYDPAVSDRFAEESRRIADAIHGNLILQPRPGHASGVYRADVSDYVAAWLVGIEWDPEVVRQTNLKNAGAGDFAGEYFFTRGAAPFERWLAFHMDALAGYEARAYGVLRPMSFANWPTTDILAHPSDRSGVEDIASVDPNALYAAGAMEEAGLFASYHVYPYYPDFINYDEKYQRFVDQRGEPNNYAGYLADLKSAHRLPILVAEFGVPGSRGKAHESRFGWNQGFLTEQEQGAIDARLFEDIMARGMMGGLVFTWQDEWFKRTWNTMDYDNPDRRPFWSNAQNNEQQFGLLSFDRHKIRVDGKPGDWSGESLYRKDGGPLRALYADWDERYLYLRVDSAPGEGLRPILLLDTVPGLGSDRLPELDSLRFSDGVDFLADLRPENPRLRIDAYYDFYHFTYGGRLKGAGALPLPPAKNGGSFIGVQYVLSREYAPFGSSPPEGWSAYETGRLREGVGDPDAENYDSLADFMAGPDGTLELRIPWLLLQAKDPSRKEFMGDLYRNGPGASLAVDGIRLGVLLADGDGRVLDSFPALEGGVLAPLKAWSWPDWDQPQSAERLKRSYYALQEEYAKH